MKKAVWVTGSKLPHPERHNYFKKVLALQACATAGEVVQIDILHNDDCGVYLDDYCDCDVIVRPHLDETL